MAENRNNKRTPGSSRSGGAKKSTGSYGTRSSYSNKGSRGASATRSEKPYTTRSASDEGGTDKKPSKKEKSFSRNKAIRSEKSSEGYKPYPKSKGSGFKPKAFKRDRSETSEKTPYARNDKYAEKKFGNDTEKSDKYKGDFKDKSDSRDKDSFRAEYKKDGYKKDDFKKEGYKGKPSFKSKEGLVAKKRDDSSEEKSYRKKDDFKKEGYKDKDNFKSKTDYPSRKPYGSGKEGGYVKKDGYKSKTDYKPRKYNDSTETDSSKRYKLDEFEERSSYKKSDDYATFKNNKGKARPIKKDDDGLVRLNKFLSNAGVASRRDADTLIQSGAVKVNGVVITEMGYKVKPTDDINYGGEAVKGERKVYLLLNKPKDCITTTDDPQERKTVMNLIKNACKERIYPVGRLDRNTTGLLLMTNDGEIAARLTHPKYNIKKVYQVSLTKGLKTEDLQQIQEGVELEDGFIKADEIAYLGEGKKEIGIEIHSGRNRIVRRLFEHLGYDVLKLDRVSFAGLTKKDLPRGKYRFLEAKEVAFLRMIGG